MAYPRHLSYSLVIFLLCMVPSASLGQGKDLQAKSTYLDEYDRLMLITNPSDDNIEKFLDLISIYSEISIDTSQLLIDKVSDIVEGKNVILETKLDFEQANIMMLRGEHIESIAKLNDILSSVKTLKDKTLEIASLQLMGNNNEKAGNFEEAIDYYLNAASMLIETKDQTNISKLYGNIAGVFFNTNQLDKAAEYNEKALKISNENEDIDQQVDALGLKAIITMTQGIHYYLQNERDTLKLEATTDSLNRYFQKSAQEFEEGLQLSKSINDKQLKLSLINNYVALNLNMGNFDKAEELSIQAVKTAEEIGAIDPIIQSRLNLSGYYRRTGQIEKSLEYAKECLELSKKHNLERKEYLSYTHLFQSYSDLKDWENAVLAQDQMRSYEINLAEADRTKAMANAENKFQAALKDKENLLLKTKTEKIVRQRNTAIGGGLLTTLFLLLLYKLNKTRKEKNDKIEFTKAILYAQEEERKSIASDLHDGIGQSLLLIKKQMDLNQETNLENSQRIGQTLEEVRAISRGLHPFQLEKFGLTNTIKNTIEQVSKSTNLFITSEIVDIDGLVPPKSEIQVYRVIQEALNNIIKHSEATAAKVNISSTADNILISIQDNGRGFDPELTVVGTKSLGLKTMNERTLTLGGSFSIRKNDNNVGTQIIVNIPLQKL